MAGKDEAEVKDVERVEIAPAGKDEENVDAETTEPESSPAETDGEVEDDTDTTKPDELVKPTIPPAEAAKPEAEVDVIAEVEGETPRERALRLELTKTRGRLRQEQGQDLLGNEKPAPAAKKELAPEKAAVLGKYKPEEIAALKEVFPVLAEEMGFVRSDELAGNNYAEKAQDSLDTFLDKHPEYQPQNDKEGTLWGAFKEEYKLYKQPTNPRDFAKIFERIHRDVFGIKPAGPLPKVQAQKEKAQVASHQGASPAPAAQRASKGTTPGLRLDMLKGFDQEELDEMAGE